jgi:hypothetical protein
MSPSAFESARGELLERALEVDATDMLTPHSRPCSNLLPAVGAVRR